MRVITGVFIFALAVVAAPDAYVFRDGDVTWMLGKGMSSHALKQIQSQFGREFLWARRNGQTFVSHDEDVIDQARSVVRRKETREEQEARLAAITDAAMRQRSSHHQSYVLAADESRVTISAGTDIKSVKSIRNRYRRPFLWVRRDAQSWLIEDPDWVDRASAFFAGERSLAPEQAAVSREDSELDREESRLEDRRDDASRTRLAEVRRRQAEVSRREEELDRREEAIEREAESKLWSLIDDAVRRGVARRLR